jgi:hypothetical protein
MAVAPCAWAQGGTTVVEREPNDSPATATPIAIGDAFTGQISSSGDLDYFAIDVTAGSQLQIAGRSDMSMGIGLVDRDGKTWLAWIPSRVEYDAPLKYPITVSGRYYISVERWDGSAAYNLQVTAAPFRLGPADPLKPFAQNDQNFSFNSLIALSSGDWFAQSGSWVMRISRTGAVIPFVTNRRVLSMAVDGFGNLLTFGDDKRILTFTPAGEESVFYEWQEPYDIAGGVLTVGPDGDVWLAWTGDTVSEALNRFIPLRMLYRLNPLGRVKSEIDLRAVAMDGWGFRSAAFSPAGDLHLTTSAGIYKVGVASQQPELVFPIDLTPVYEGWPADCSVGLAFDRDGYLYLAAHQRLVLLDPSYRVVQDTVAHVRGFAGALAFGRDPGGGNKTTARFMVGRYAELAELNAAGVRAPGWPVGPQGPIATVMQVPGGAVRRGMVDAAYADTLRALGALAATGSLTWSVASGRLPAGLDLLPSGVVGGEPTESGSFAFEAQATNGGQTATGRFTIVVAPHRVAVSIVEIAAALMGGPALSPDILQYLDSHGNRNGVLDVADLRAYLRAQGNIGASARSKP